MTTKKIQCDLCPPGEYMVRDCNSTRSRVCAKCERRHFTATGNSLKRCNLCKDCPSDNNLKTMKACTAQEDTVCECRAGMYCGNGSCDHCQSVSSCPEGEGVKVKASRTSDTVCETCQDGTYSNVTDWTSPCRPHTRCEEDLGRALKTEGTSKADAVCGDFQCKVGQCRWELPAALWAGLVVTALVLFAVVMYRKARRGSRRADSTKRSVTLVRSVDLTLPATSLDLSLPDPKETDYCQESCTVLEYKLPIFGQDENLVICSLDSSLPITPLKASVSFAEENYNNKGTGYCPGNFLRTPSEPQEDEWCGT